MFSKTLVALVMAASALAADLTIGSPASLIVCQPVQINLAGGTGPYIVAVIPGNQPSAAALKDFGTETGPTFTWTVDLAAGTSVTLKATDSLGVLAYSSAITIQAGSSTSCLNSTSSAAGSASGTAVAVAASGSSAVSSAVSSAASSAGAVTSSVAASASSVAASGMSVASSAMSAASSKASSATASGTSSTSASSAAATTSKAAGFPVTRTSGGIIAAVAGLVGVALF